MTPEEAVLFAIALDLEESQDETPPLLRGDIKEIGIEVKKAQMGQIIRILVVTEQENRRTDVDRLLSL